MAKTASHMIPLGTKAPWFSLIDVVTGKTIQLKEPQGELATVIFFICNHCPYVKHINTELTRLANDYMPKNVRFIAINANNTHDYPEDSPENMKRVAQEQAYPFPYAFDETQEVAKAYNAACTPDFYLFDENLSLVYRGQLDDSRPGNDIPVTGESLREALNAVIENHPVSGIQKPSMGCNIKWKA